MSVATEKITEIQDQVRDVVARIQEPVVNGFQAVATKVEDRLPEFHVPDLGDKVSTAQLTEARDKVGEKLTDIRKQLVETLLTATEPVRRMFVAEPTAKATTKPAAKPAAKSTKAKAA
jgi:hypothetical protein